MLVSIHTYISQRGHPELYWNTAKILREYNQETFPYFQGNLITYRMKSYHKESPKFYRSTLEFHWKNTEKFSSVMPSYSSGFYWSETQISLEKRKNFLVESEHYSNSHGTEEFNPCRIPVKCQRYSSGIPDILLFLPVGKLVKLR